MIPLRQALDDYLTMRRGLGFKLERAEKLLAQFLAYLGEVGADAVTAEQALAWARLPADADRSWWSYRLSVVRGFAIYLRTLDGATEVPAAELLPWRRRRRATPYLYTDAEIAALLAACASLRFPLRVATYRTLIGLLTVAGLRVGEAIRLDRDDLDVERGRPLRGRKPKAPPEAVVPSARANTSDPDSALVRAAEGFLQGYNGQIVATADQIVIAAELSTDSPDGAPPCSDGRGCRGRACRGSSRGAAGAAARRRRLLERAPDRAGRGDGHRGAGRDGERLTAATKRAGGQAAQAPG